MSDSRKYSLMNKYVLVDLKRAIKSYQCFEHYMLKLNGNLYSKRFRKFRHLENQYHNDYAYYIDNAMDCLWKMFNLAGLDWRNYLKSRHIVSVENYQTVVLNQIKHIINSSNTTKSDKSNDIARILDVLSTDLNHSKVRYNIHTNEQITDKSINPIVVANIYNYLVTNSNINSPSRLTKKINDFKTVWTKYCQKLITGLDINIYDID